MKIDFETVAELKAARLQAGFLVRTKGKNSVNDGEDNVYLIQTPAQFPGTPNEIDDFVLVNANIARALKGSLQIRNTEAQVRGANDGFIDLSPRIPRIVDGRLDNWFEAFSQTSSGYGSSTMWRNENSGSTKTTTRETLVLGTDIPTVPSARFYSRTVVTSVAGAGNFVRKTQRIEDVRTYAGQSIVISLFGRADSSKNISVELVQNFGSGGSPSAEVTGIGAQKVLLSSSFSRKTALFDVPIIAGKTIGTDENDYLELVLWFDAGSSFDGRTDSLGQQSGTFDIACVQDDIGTEVKPYYEFDPKENLDRTNRNFERLASRQSSGTFSIGAGNNNTTSTGIVHFDYLNKRAVPDITTSADTTFLVRDQDGANQTLATLTITNEDINSASAGFGGASNLVKGGGTVLFGNTSAFIDIDARL